MSSNNLKRLSRLTAILLKLQTSKLITAFHLSDLFSVSIRTIYRDIRALELAGIPIITIEGKGYSLKEDFYVSPVMFTERQANALIIAEKLIFLHSDKSLLKDYSEAIEKIIAGLTTEQKSKIKILTDRTQLNQNFERKDSSHFLSDLQIALTNCFLTEIEYTNEQKITTKRKIEPFALLITNHWLLLANCRFRKEFRFFRLDRISRLEILSEKFTSHNMTLQEFFSRNY